MIESGKLRTKLVIQTKVISIDPNTQETIETPVDFATWHCKLELNGGGSYWAAQKINTEISGIAKGRYIPGVNTTMTALYNNETYEIIKTYDPEERHAELEIHLKLVK